MTHQRRPSLAIAKLATARAAIVVTATAACLAATAPSASAAPLHLLFVGNSFTHGRYDPVREFNSGYDTGPGAVAAPHVHDLLCPSAAACTPAENLPADDPDTFAYPPGTTTLLDRLAFLSADPAAQYAEHGPFGGIPGLVLAFGREAGLDLDVSIIAVSAATLDGRSFNGSPANSALIGSARWDHVVLQDQSFEPLPATVVVNGVTVPTKGDQAAFAAGVSGLVGKIDAADAAAGRAPIPVTLYETWPLASYDDPSNNPAAPIYGTSTSPPGGVDAPYVGAADPNGQMAADLHAAYFAEAAAWDGANPTGSRLDVAPSGDAFVSAIRLGLAEADPFLVHEPPGQVDLWDGDALDACCLAPIGYHPSVDGAYLSASVLFGQLTGRDPLSLPLGEAAARALRIPPLEALALRAVASVTLARRGPVPPL